MKNIFVIFFCVLVILTTSCGSQQESSSNQGDTTSEGLTKNVARNIPKNYQKIVGLGVISLHPDYKKNQDSHFELYLTDKLHGEPEKFNPNKPEEYSRAKPIYYDKGKGISYFLCLGWKPGSYMIVINDVTGEVMHLPEDATRYIHFEWGDFLLESKNISRKNPQENPIKDRPNDFGKELNWQINEELFEVVGDEQQWLQVKNPNKPEEIGWLRWVKNDTLFVDFEPFVIDNEIIQGYSFNELRGRWEKKDVEN